MSLKKAFIFILIPGLLASAAMVLFTSPAASPQVFAPAVRDGAVDQAPQEGPVRPVVVDLRDIPAGVYDPNNQYDRWRRGEIRLERGDSIIDRSKIEDMRVAAMNLPASSNITLAGASGLDAPTAGASFDSMDYTECCGGGGNVPPDPELAVGPLHVVAVVNVAFEIYNKSGDSLVGPTTFSSFMAADPNCTGVFDPNAIYDEAADRYILGIDADGTHYCLAVSQTGDPTGSWNLYSFQTGGGRDFFDYPHAGVGRDAIYMGANIFRRSGGPFGGYTFKEARVWAFDKAAMYAGQAAASASKGLATSEDTPQPLHLHGWTQGTWPTSGPHYFFTNTNYNGDTYSVFSWSNPFGGGSLTKVGTVNLETATGVASGMPVDTPQLGGGTIQANDFRPQDFEFRDGFAWSAMTVSCNPGGGTVNCVRWAKINPATASVADAGVYASSGQYRTFADLAVDACGNMAIGYTKSSSSIHPGIWVTGRLATDPAGTLQSETQLKAGEIAYISFETSPPRRWGDYTEMTIDPTGTTFWYLGEYSKNTGTTQGRWGTYIGAFSYACNPGGNAAPVVTITAPADGSAFDQGTSVSFAGTANDPEDGNISAGLAWTSNLDGQIGSGASFSTSSLRVGVHIITAEAADSGGRTGSDSIAITINSTDPGDPISLSVSLYKIKGNKYADLTWSGATTANVDIYRNGTILLTTTNDGAHTDGPQGKGGGSVSYQVCETGSTPVCSAVVTQSW